MRKREIERKREKECLCMPVCKRARGIDCSYVRKREGERECVCECGYARKRETESRKVCVCVCTYAREKEEETVCT